MEIMSKRFTTSGPLPALDVVLDPEVVAAGTVLVCYKSGSTYTVMTFTLDSTSAPTKTRVTGLAALDAETAFTDWQALQP